MIARHLHKFLLLSLSTNGCGTYVNVGDNNDTGRIRPGNPIENDLDEDNDVVLNEDGTATTPSSGSKKVGGIKSADQSPQTCFGAAGTLNSFLEPFCTSLASQVQTDFPFAVDALCSNFKYSNLFLDPCSWSGAGDYSAYFKVVDRTDLKDPVHEFNATFVFSVTIPANLAD